MTVHLQESSQTCNRNKSCVATWLAQGGAPVLYKGQGFPRMPSASLCVNGGRMSGHSLGIKSKGSGSDVSNRPGPKMVQDEAKESPGTITTHKNPTAAQQLTVAFEHDSWQWPVSHEGLSWLFPRSRVVGSLALSHENLLPLLRTGRPLHLGFWDIVEDSGQF